MSGSCHLDRASNVELGVECWIFVIIIFFNCNEVLQFGELSRYYKGALTQKRSFLVIHATFRSDFGVNWKNHNNYSSLHSSFNTLSKWQEPKLNPKKPLVFCYQNYSDLLWEKIVLVIEKNFGILGWRSRICKIFEMILK